MGAELFGSSVAAPWANGSGDNAGYVTQQMIQVGGNIQQLLRLLEELNGQADGLRGRIDSLRHEDERIGEFKPSELAAWKSRRGGELQALERDIEDLGRRMAGLMADLRRAEDELQRLQGESLPAAQMRDLTESWTRVEQERQRLDAELQQQRDEIKKLGVGKRDTEGLAKRASASRSTLRSPPPKTDLATAAPADEKKKAGTPADAQKEQLGEIVQLIGNMLKTQRGGKQGKNSAAWSSTPISSMTATLQSRWSSLVAQMSVDGWMDVNQLIQWVMREAYVNNTEDLKFYAYKVKFFTELKKRIRSELTRARSFQSQHQSAKDSNVLDAPFNMVEFSLQPDTLPDGSLTPRDPEAKSETSNAKELDEYIKDLDQQLSSVGDDAQLAQVDLQNVTQRQQQSLQTLSNLSKVLHETSMAIIRKIGS